MKALVDTTSHRDGLQRVPLSRGIGSAVFVNDLTRAEIRSAVRYLTAGVRDERPIRAAPSGSAAAGAAVPQYAI